MPLTASGKIDLQALPRYVLTRVRPARQLVPRTPTQEKLLAIWKDVLKTEDVGITDNFFELGGHSIRAVQMLARAAEVFGVNVPLRRFFQEPVIQGLERALSELSHGAHP
jgi:acyl carrier protein